MNQIRIGIIGCGNNGCGHARTLAGIPGVHIVAGADPACEQRDRITKILPDITVHDDYQAMLDDESLDAVCISTPHVFHYEQALNAMQHGCHVLLEKPMAIQEDHCRKLVAAAAEHNRILQVGFECRTSKLYSRVKDIVRSGELGELASINFVHYRGMWKRDWYFDKAMAGTIATIETCHYIDLIRFWSEKDVVSAYALAARRNLMQKYGYPDSSYAVLEFEDGLVASITDSHARAAENVSQGSKTTSYGSQEGGYLNPVFGHQFEYTLVGTKGSLWVRMFAKQISVLGLVETGNGTELHLKRVEDFSEIPLNELIHYTADEDHHFVHNIRSGSTPDILPEDALRTHLACFAIEESEETGEKVTIAY